MKGLLKNFAPMVVAVAGIAGIATTGAQAAGPAVDLLERDWSFEGMFGSFDKASAQRGFQVYREVCASCHGLKYVAFRTLADIGYDEDMVKAFAAEYTVVDGPDDNGDMFERPGVASDYIPSPYPNAKAAAAANGGKAPPDLSLITKARPDGVNYVYSLMQGYADEPPAGVDIPDGGNYNAYFPGHVIAMPQILYGEDVEYMDGTPATLEQQSADIAQFLHWAAEPKLEERKSTGLASMIFLVIFTGIFFAYKKRVWADLH